MKKTFVPSAAFPPDHSVSAYWFVFRENELLVNLNNSHEPLPFLHDLATMDLPVVRQQFLGVYDGHPCYSVEAATEANPPGDFSFENLRATFFKIDKDFIIIAGRAIQVINWDRNHQFCGRCGSAMETSKTEHVKTCPNCNLVNYPRLSPAVIVAVQKEGKILLGRAKRFPNSMFSVLAGFVEPGESLEETVKREIFEEAGIRVKNIRYFGSQPWPFPNSLMVGFTAEYASGEIAIDEDELVEAGWFSVEDLPNIPPSISIARQLIDDFIRSQKTIQGI